MPDVKASQICRENPLLGHGYLALDLGTTTGWAVQTPRLGRESGVAKFQHGKHEGAGMRYLRFVAWLDEIAIVAGPFHQVWFEEVRRHVGTDAAHVYGGLLATLTTWCEGRMIPYSGVGVGTIKKHVAGKGNAAKDEMVAAVRSHGFSPADHNEADAIAVLLYATQVGAKA